MSDNRPAPDFSAVLVSLMKGVVFRERQPKLWQDLLEVQARIVDYVALLGLELAIDFSHFGSDIFALKKRLRADERIAVFDSFTQYAGEFRRRLGI